MRHKRRGCAWKCVWRLTPGQDGQASRWNMRRRWRSVSPQCRGCGSQASTLSKGLFYQGAPTQDNILAAKEEGEMMAEAARSIRAAGVAIQDVSAGSSPTGVAVAQTGLVTEVQSRHRIFLKTRCYAANMWRSPSRSPVRYAATVVRVQHGEYAVLDGGSKTFATDIPLNAPPFYYPGYAAVEGRPDLCLSRMNEERRNPPQRACGQTKLKAGDVLTLVPIHVCTAVNQQNAVYLLENGRPDASSRGRPRDDGIKEGCLWTNWCVRRRPCV